MSLTSLLSIARSALLTQQRAIDVTGHNVANANTEGYTRQRLNLAPQPPQLTSIGQLGRGVSAVGIERLRDQFLDAAYRRENGDLGQFTTAQDILTQVGDILGEPSGNGLGAGLDSFFAAWGDLANAPAEGPQRALVRQAGQNLAQQFQDLDRRLGEAAADVQGRMASYVSEVNDIMRRVAELNTKVQSTSAGLREAPDVKDERDKLLDQLSSIVHVRVVPHQDGTIGVAAGDALLVDGGQYTTFELRDLGGGRYGVGVTGVGGTINMQSGNLAALTTLSQTTLPGLRQSLDALVKGLVTEVNSLHRAGTSLIGQTGLDFFDPAGTTAASLGISDAVAVSTDNIAAGQSGGGGDNANALALAALQTTGVNSFGGRTIAEAYQQMVSDLAVQGQEADRRMKAQDVVVNSLDQQRKSVSGVSIDEELTNMIAQQNAYSAAAKLVTVADQMMQDVIAMVR
jgi:flagellar hook-associated protein 1 FlgK